MEMNDKAIKSTTDVYKPETTYAEPTAFPLRESPTDRIKRERIFHILFGICLLIFTASVGRAETYQIIATENSVVGNNLNKTVKTVQVGSNPLNRFLISRVTQGVA